MGAVYQAMDESVNCMVAVKETFAATDEHRRAFKREAELLANLSHQALPKVTHHFAEGEGQFLIMQYVPGNDLSELLGLRERPFAVGKVLEWADTLLDALEELHSHHPPIVHRDIKPANLKLTPRGKIILLDFGLAKGAAGGMSQDDPDSGKSIYGYTRYYAPIEQIRGSGTDPRSDLYSLAATMWTLLTAQIPPDALARLSDSAVDGNADPLKPAHELNPEVPVAVSMVFHKAMAINRADRFAGAKEMRDALQKAIHAPAVETRPDQLQETMAISEEELRRMSGQAFDDSEARRQREEQMRREGEARAAEVREAEASRRREAERRAAAPERSEAPTWQHPSSGGQVHQSTPPQIHQSAPPQSHQSTPPQVNQSTPPAPTMLNPGGPPPVSGGYPPTPQSGGYGNPQSGGPPQQSVVGYGTPQSGGYGQPPSGQQWPGGSVPSQPGYGNQPAYGNPQSYGNQQYPYQYQPPPSLTSQPLSQTGRGGGAKLLIALGVVILVILLASVAGIAYWMTTREGTTASSSNPTGTKATGGTTTTGTTTSTTSTTNNITASSIKALGVVNAPDGVHRVALSQDGKTAASASNDNVVRLWQTSNGSLLRELRGHTGTVMAVAITPNGQTVASGSQDGEIRLWNLSDGRLIKSWKGHSDSVWKIGFSTDGATLFSAGYDKTVKVWRTSDGSQQASMTLPPNDLVITVSHDLKTAALFNPASNNVELWSIQDSRLIRSLEGHNNKVSNGDFSPDNQNLALGSYDGPVRIWSVSNGQSVKTLNGGSARVGDVAYSPDGQLIAVGYVDGTVYLLKASDGSVVKKFDDHQRGKTIWSVAFSDNKQVFASASDDRTIRLWQLAG